MRLDEIRLVSQKADLGEKLSIIIELRDVLHQSKSFWNGKFGEVRKPKRDELYSWLPLRLTKVQPQRELWRPTYETSLRVIFLEGRRSWSIYPPSYKLVVDRLSQSELIIPCHFWIALYMGYFTNNQPNCGETASYSSRWHA